MRRDQEVTLYTSDSTGFYETQSLDLSYEGRVTIGSCYKMPLKPFVLSKDRDCSSLY
jgi:hypothetical protein